MKKIIIICSLIAVAIAGWFGVSLAQAEEKVQVSPEKVLVVYYSWGGNTRSAAEEVAAATGGTLAEIIPDRPYPSAYSACVDQAKQEIREGFRPSITLSPQVDISLYDVVLIGSPNWWSTLAPPVSSFLASHPLNGKTSAVFVTHGGGGMAHCEKDARRQARGARFLKGGAFPGSSIHESKEEIREWVDSILQINK